MEPKRNEHGSDVCYCGDYRSQHSRMSRAGALGTRCFCGCEKFRWGHKAKKDERAHWEDYHGKHATYGAQKP